MPSGKELIKMRFHDICRFLDLSSFSVFDGTWQGSIEQALVEANTKLLSSSGKRLHMEAKSPGTGVNTFQEAGSVFHVWVFSCPQQLNR